MVVKKSMMAPCWLDNGTREKEQWSEGRLIYSIIICGGQMWPMRQNLYTFLVIYGKVSNDTWCLRTLLINVTIKSAHCDCERNSCKYWVGLKMCGKRSWMWSKAKHCIKGEYLDPKLPQHDIPQHANYCVWIYQVWGHCPLCRERHLWLLYTLTLTILV